ncbi:c-type cytochrome [Pontibacter flavimaris]|uniref:Cytochrome C n=1 Tax=Pontibacter flavimaris TaxID=1797110 RepID=A0A1Q5PIJ1_9BACT|nr:cytochrome c [Pontibacter flavimaris]OKL42039.1 cytochrome C [Pontibacter flavimaris]
MRKNPSESMMTKLFKPLQLAVMAMLFSTVLFSCSSGDGENTAATDQEESGLANQAEAPAEDDGKGVGPVTSVEVGEGIDEALAAEGKTIFEGKCSACHQLSDQKIVGPGLAGVTDRRKPEWIMNMMINPEEMTKKDPQAKKLLAEHLTQMTNQNITESDARALLEFLRQNDQNS